MGGFFNKLFKRPEAQIQKDLQNNLVLTGVHSALLPDSEPDIAQKQQLGPDLLYIEDEEIRALLYLLMMEEVAQIKFNDKGEIEYLRDEGTGELKMDGNGHPIPQYVRGQKVKLTWAAVYTLCSNITSLEIVLPQDKALYRIDIDEVIDDTIDKLTEQEIEEGGITLLYAIRSFLYRQLDDSVNGNKLKIMRELRISKELGLRVNPKEKKAIL